MPSETPQKKMDLPQPVGINCRQLPGQGWDTVSTSHFSCFNLYMLPQSESIGVSILLCLEDTVSLMPSIPQVLKISLNFVWRGLIMTPHSGLGASKPLSQHLVLVLCQFPSVPICREPSLMWSSEGLLYRCSVCHQESFYCCFFSRIILVGFPLGRDLFLFQVLGHFSSARYGFHFMRRATTYSSPQKEYLCGFCFTS